MRLRVRELLEQRRLTAYGLAQASAGRISLSAAYRLERGDFRTISADRLEALCDVLGVSPGDLFTREPALRQERPRPRGRRKPTK